MFTLQVMSEKRAYSLEAEQNPPAYASQDSLLTEVFTRILQDTLGFTTSEDWILAEDGYETQVTVLYWKFTKIRYWFQLKFRIPVIHGGIYIDI